MKKLQKTEKLRPLLNGCFLFRDTEEKLADFALADDGCEYVAFSAGETIYTRANFRRSMGLVASGVLRSVKPVSGGGQIVLGSFGPGDMFGAAALFNNHKRYVAHIISMKNSRVLFLSEHLLHRLFEQDARAAENYIACLSERIYYLNTKIDGFTGGRVETRLARYLGELYTREKASRFQLPCNLTVLSGALDVGRASLYRAFDALTEQGCLRRTGRTIEIVDWQELRSLYI